MCPDTAPPARARAGRTASCARLCTLWPLPLPQTGEDVHASDRPHTPRHRVRTLPLEPLVSFPTHEYDQQGSHCSSPGSDHALATHRRRWGFEQLRDVRGPTRQETPARIAGEARFFRPPTHPVSSGIGGVLERAASSTAATGQHRLPHGLWGAGCCRSSRPRTFD